MHDLFPFNSDFVYVAGLLACLFEHCGSKVLEVLGMYFNYVSSHFNFNYVSAFYSFYLNKNQLMIL